ncbi:ABC transporter permease [Bradyrhizobium prioriisuperbiae]|uniref:ABC transporter permease n=1 Tax=Bradyrhizobium prioriisuperbiae TaxID=2854389 RepID=UPI0028E42AC5|nr:ABC transporter permease [Bradyrhizobium prioritasuperba]
MTGSLKGLIFPVAVLLLWEILARSGFFTSTSLSNPSAIVAAGWGLVLDGSLWRATRETFGAALGGMAIGAVLGMTVGVAFGLSRLLASLMRLSMESLRPVPSVALIPLALLIYGYGYRMEIAVVAFACFWPVMIVTESAVRGIEPRLIEVARALKFPVFERVTKIILPAALPRVFVGLRLAAAISLVVAVTVEITTNPIGLGYGLIVAQEGDRADRVFAFLFWIGFLGWLLNALLLRAQRHWFGKYGNWMETAR